MEVVRAVQRVLVDVAVDVAEERGVGVGRATGRRCLGAFAPGAAAEVREVRVDRVRQRGHQERDPRPGDAPWRPDDEREVILVVAGDELGGVHAARQVGGDRQLQVDIPAGVLEVVAMEVDRAVLLGRRR